MTITTTKLTGVAAVAAVAPGLIFVLIPFIHIVSHGRPRRLGGRSAARTVGRLARCPIAILRTPATNQPEAG